MDDGTRRLAIIAGGLGAVLIGVVGIWSLSGHRQGGRVPVIEADSRPLRVKPLNPGGMQLAGSNDEILSGDTSPQNGKLAPAPEAPEPEALRAKLPPAPKAVPAAAVASAQPEPPPAPVVASTPTPPVPPAAALKTAAEAAKPETTAAAGRPALVQLAALGSEDDAKAEWSRLSRRMPDLLKGHSPAVMKTEHDGRTFWRLRTGGFSDSAQATAFCERVRAKGAGCSIASF
jgi:hypothetical protein